MKLVLDECRDKEPDARPSSLDVLEVAHQHVDTRFPSLENELTLAAPNSLIFHAFLSIAKQLDDNVPIVIEATVCKRGVQMRRLNFLLQDGALHEFIVTCRELQLAVLFGEYAKQLVQHQSDQHSAKVPAEHVDAPEPQSPAHWMCGDMLEMLLSQDQNPDEQWPKSRWTALHIAAQEGKPDMVRRLLASKANPSRRDARGMTPRDYASEIRTLCTAEETEVASLLDKENNEPWPDDDFLIELQHRLSESRSRTADFAGIEDILRRAEEAQNVANSTSVKGNTYNNISGDAFHFVGGQLNMGGEIHVGEVYFSSTRPNIDRK
ncbi:hypothetical protein GE09DRAFT_631031 [Coniochaeta sp. 2T2.1]|nr:hypothetical protein GE09DRAFT_631031 [Coniochaeta sp. 2T2.1]